MDPSEYKESCSRLRRGFFIFKGLIGDSSNFLGVNVLFLVNFLSFVVWVLVCVFWRNGLFVLVKLITSFLRLLTETCLPDAKTF